MVSAAEHQAICDNRERVYIDAIEAHATALELALGLSIFEAPAESCDYWSRRWARITERAVKLRRAERQRSPVERMLDWLGL